MLLLLSLVTNAMLKNYFRAVGHGETLPKYLYQGGRIYELIKPNYLQLCLKGEYFL
jgi:hypothetical protein